MQRRGGVRKRRRKRATFARLRTNAKRSAYKAPGAALLPAQPTKGAYPTPFGRWINGTLPRTRIKIGPFSVRAVLPQNFGWRKYKERPLKPWWLGGRSACFIRQNSTAERTSQGKSRLPLGKLRFLTPPCLWKTGPFVLFGYFARATMISQHFSRPKMPLSNVR